MNSDNGVLTSFFDILNKYKWHALFALCGLLYFRVSSLQIDPHHDGVILSPAIAVSEGLTVQAQSFTQYGPLSPLLQGFWLWLTDPTLLNLRIFTAIQVGFIAFLLRKVVSEYINLSMANLITLLWLTCSGVWATKFPGALLPWPSLVSTLFALSAYLLFLKSFKSADRKSSAYLVASGILIGLSGFARIQSWILVAPLFLALLLNDRKRFKNALKLILGFIIGIIGMIGYLFSVGAFDDYIKQSIIFPLTVYPQLGSDNRYNRFETGLYVIELFVLIAFTLIIWKLVSQTKYWISQVCGFGLSILILYWGFWIQRQDSLWIRLRILFGEPFERLLVSPLYAAAVGSILALVYFAFRSRLIISRIRTQPFVPAMFAAIAAIQLFPQSDVMHLWWISPLCLPFLAQSINSLSLRFGEEIVDALRITFSTFVIFGLLFALNFIKGPWIEYELPVLKGTYASAEKVERVDFYGDILKYATPSSSSFDCGDGLYSVSGGKYLAADQWFVNWGYSATTKRDIGAYRFICDQSLDYANSEAERLGMKVIKYSEHTRPDYPWSLAILKKG